MIQIYFPHDSYSKNKNAIKKPIKNFGLKWNFGSSSWVGVDTTVIGEFQGTNLPATLIIESDNQDFINEMISVSKEVGGEIKADEIIFEDEEAHIPFPFRKESIERHLERERPKMMEHFKDEKVVEIQLECMRKAFYRIRERYE